MSDNFSEDLEVVDVESKMIRAQPQTMVQMRSTFMTAVKPEVPRQLTEVQRRLSDEARLAGDTFFYGWGSGKDRIEGKTQALAHAAMRCWGNCALEHGPIQELPDSWVFTAYFIDIESGTTLARPFRMSKDWKVYGRHDDARKDDIRFQIGASKAARNVILKALPQWLTDRAMKDAKAGVREKIEKYITSKGLVAAQDAALGRLMTCGVMEDVVLARFEIAEKKALDLDKLVIINGDLKAIDDGEARPEDLYPTGPSKSPVTTTTTLESFGEASTTAKPAASGNGDQPPEEAKPAGRLTPESLERIRGMLEVDPQVPEADLVAALGVPLQAFEATTPDAAYSVVLRKIKKLKDAAKSKKSGGGGKS